jgi:hypothetical protein
MRTCISIATFGVLVTSFAGTASGQAAPWPGSAGVEIGQLGAPGGLPAGYEPSGAVWHRGLERLVIVGDDGDVTVMDRDGGAQITWSPGGDLEGVTVVDHTTPIVYLGREHPDAVIEFDLSTGLPTGAIWDLTPWMTGSNNLGLEALTYAGGLFYAGLQADGNVFVFDLQPAGVVVHVNTLAPHAGRADVAGLHYDEQTGVLYTVHDGDDVVVERTLAGAFLNEYSLLATDQEGIALVPCCSTGEATIFLADDGGTVWRYEAYPVTCGAGPFELYCTAGTSASGCNALLAASGTPSASAASGFSLSAAGVEGNTLGLFFFGKGGRQTSSWGNGTSLQCVVPPVKRAGLLAGGGTAGACDGAFSQDLNARWTAKPNQNPGPGAIVQAQLWHRDPFNTSNQSTSLSDAIEFCVGP